MNMCAKLCRIPMKRLRSPNRFVSCSFSAILNTPHFDPSHLEGPANGVTLFHRSTGGDNTPTRVAVVVKRVIGLAYWIDL